MSRDNLILGVVVLLVIVVLTLVYTCLYTDTSTSSLAMWLCVSAAGLTFAAGGLILWEKGHNHGNTSGWDIPPLKTYIPPTFERPLVTPSIPLAPSEVSYYG